MTTDPWFSIVVGAAIAFTAMFLLTRGQYISDQRAARRTQDDRRARIDREMAAERDPGRRTAWRMIRNRNEGEQ